MNADRAHSSRAGLVGTGLLLLGLLLAGALLIAVQPSQALSPAEAGAANPPADSLPANGTYTVTMPMIFRAYAPARFTITKSVTPDSVMTSPTAMVTYTVTIVNEGTEPGAVSAVKDLLPAGFTWKAMAAGSDVLTGPDKTTGLITWSKSPAWQIAGGGRLRLIYQVWINQALGTYVNQATAVAQAGIPPAGPATAAVTVLPATLMEDNFNDGIGRWTEFLNYSYRLRPGQWYWGPTDGIGGSGALSHDALKVPGWVAGDGLMMYLQPGAQDWTNYRVEVKQYLTGGVSKYGEPEPEDGFPIGLWVRGHWQASETNAQWVTGYYVIVKSCTAGPSSGCLADTHWVRLAQPHIPGDCGPCNPDTEYAFNNVKVLCDWFQTGCGTGFPGEYNHFQWYTLTVEVRGNNIKAWLDGELAFDYTDDNQPFLSGTVGFKTHETKIASFDDIVVVPLP